jgi:uncharacterized protein YutE (UPF0331/DUF86 family)
MKDKLRILVADIQDDLKTITEIQNELNTYTKSLTEPPDRYQKMVIGYLMHNFYNACENIFLNIARIFENSIEPQEWHKSILKRMKLSIKDVRPAVISERLYKLLNDFRGFRHVFRHLYSDELDWDKEKLLVNKFDNTVEGFIKDIGEFINFLEELINQD